MKRSILLIYTGGTIGMKQDEKTLALVPFDFSQILNEVPELKKFGYEIDSFSFNPVIDSSDVAPAFWVELCGIIKKNYSRYDGFVILHGTDTMSYTASALSFMLENLEKPVVLTGSQLPIGMLRTDGKENIISSIEVAAATGKDGKAMVPEVCVFFESQLYRGNRTTKYNAENFRAFRSANYPVLAEAGIHIKYNRQFINYPKKWDNQLKVNLKLDTNIAIIKVFPGISVSEIDAIMNIKGGRAVILETYGSGNAPTSTPFLKSIERGIKKGRIIVNVSQCQAGSVDMDAYATGVALKKLGVICGYDSTTEAAIVKLFVLMGKYPDNKKVEEKMLISLSGEVTI